MADVDAIYLHGEKAPLYVTETPAVGTAQFSSAPTFTLYDAAGQIVTGFNNVPVTSYTQGASALLQAYINIDTASFAPGGYEGVMNLPLLAQDNIARVRAVSITLYVRAIPE